MDYINYAMANKGAVDPLDGKTILCIGDSMMAGNGWAGGYANCVQENHPTAIIKNIAQSGATLIQNDTGNFIFSQIKAWHDAGREEPDIILIDGGGNDCLYRATIGTGKLDSCYINGWQTTMCDALEYLIYASKKWYPNSKMLYISNPLMMQWADTTKIPSVPTPDVQLEYLVAREKVLEKWGIPIADVRRDGNLTSCISEQGSFFMDSIHMNEAGYRYVAPVIENALRKLF